MCMSNAARGFSWKHRIDQLYLSFMQRVLFLRHSSHTYGNIHCYPTYLSPSPLLLHTRWYRNINLFPISFAFRLHLRGRLTLPGLALDRNPWVFGERDFHPFYRYSCQHSHFQSLQHTLPVYLRRSWNAPLPLLGSLQLRYYALAPLYLRRKKSRSVSYYAFFKGWLLLSQPPDC